MINYTYKQWRIKLLKQKTVACISTKIPKTKVTDTLLQQLLSIRKTYKALCIIDESNPRYYNPSDNKKHTSTIQIFISYNNLQQLMTQIDELQLET